ncbi:MAG: ATP-dependent DNA helicase [Candidatus Thermoplasmatota archaeon]
MFKRRIHTLQNCESKTLIKSLQKKSSPPPTTLMYSITIPPRVMQLFPYQFRKYQRDIINDISKALQTKNHLVFESGTGSGKTICVLAATVTYALEHQKKIIYTTRTNAQQQQVILEVRAIKKKKPATQVYAVALQGRANLCILAQKDQELRNGTSEELSKFCAEQKKKTLQKKKNTGCPYYKTFIGNQEKIDEILTYTHQHLPTAEEFVAYCENKGICPYELNKLLIKHATVIVVPYIYIFDTAIRIKLFDWLSISEQDTILIVDEAHNLPDYLRELFSAQLSMNMLKSCTYELEKYGDPTLLNGSISVSQFCSTLQDIINDLRSTYIYKILENDLRKNAKFENKDAFIPTHELEAELLSRFKITSTSLQDIISDLIAYGEKIQEYRQKDGKLPRSYLHKLGIFLSFWTTLEMHQYIKLIVDSEDGLNPHIEAYCLDPSLGTEILNHFHTSIHMSGTLKPLEEYRDSLGLPKNTSLMIYPSPFPKKNRKILYTSDVTTRYEDLARDKTILPRIWSYITEICNTFPKNTIVFFPSFNTLATFKNTGCLNDIKRHIFIEEQTMSQYALMELVSEFKICGQQKRNRATMFSVMGGRISEGMDFPAEQLEIAILVGIPYPKPTARQRGLQQYYELKFRKGWEYTVEAPTTRKILQAIGRLIRNEHDRGVAVILDKRAVRFKRYLDDLTKSENITQEIHEFINEKTPKK